MHFSVLAAMALLFFSTLAHAQTLVAPADSWRYRKGTSVPASDWKTAPNANLSASWLTGPGGFGYSDSATELTACQTILNDMSGSYSTIAIRRAFQITAEIDPRLHLELTVDFDDGFIAFLDGKYLASFNSPGAPAEPAFDALAPSNHESSRGDSGKQPASVYDLGAVANRLALGTHTLALVGLNSSRAGSSDFILIPTLKLQPAPIGCESGAIAADTTWKNADSPITICGNIVVADGATLTIEPGVTVQFQNTLGITIENGGRLVAAGNETNPIHFTRAPGATNWSGILLNGAIGSPETVITHADIQYNNDTAIHSAGGSLYLDHVNFLSAGQPYVSLDNSSFIVSHCHFPAATAKFESLHGTGGIKPGGHGIFRRNFIGRPLGYSDVIDFTGGNRPGPIVHFINNVIAGSQDDGIDLDGTDAWIEGNIFLHVHRNADTPDSGAAISGGSSGGQTSELTILNNYFFDCDNAITAKQGNFYSLLNNTIVHTTKIGGIDIGSGAINLRDTTPDPTAFARGAYAEANIIFDAENLLRNYSAADSALLLINNVIPETYTGPGSGNIVADPLLTHIPNLAETTFTDWQSAQIIRAWFTPSPESPAQNLNAGATSNHGVNISGEPTGATTSREATLQIGFNRSGQNIPPGGWPNGLGYTHYKWRLDNGPWSAETPINTPLIFTALANGPHYIEAIGKLDSGLYQNDPLFGEDAAITRSKTWTVNALEEFRFQSITRSNNKISLTFDAKAGQSYTLLARETFAPDQPWHSIQNLPIQETSAPLTLEDDLSANTKFYLLVSPAIP